jgi:5-formyltetrahydrofolate cyclo-ligase
MKTKNELREFLLHNPDSKASGKIAEKLRRASEYRQATCIFVTPSPLLQHIRINCLMDGKQLVMPSSGLRDGFFQITPHTVPFNRLGRAVTERGLKEFGSMLQPEVMAKIDMLLTGAVAVNPEGQRLGSGTGYFDLSCGLLAALGALAEHRYIAAVINRQHLVNMAMPVDPWDVEMNGILTEEGLQPARPPSHRILQIFWSQLSPERIKRINPLFTLREKQGKSPTG